ncbi:hypothetical protein KIW84_052191 [Lathyrus oleraceus]|uniref:Uncharacterized protein n=1 Tax=Pisum sativum TaxID=3888 RepID=A0A9D4WRG9_PEA|nr:hypothetical protein KIW84_052191 [Pisum sativum]
MCLPIILLHGFGASVFSWKQVMKPLAEATCSKVLAFDRPTFELTSRVNLSSGDARQCVGYNIFHGYECGMVMNLILIHHGHGGLLVMNQGMERPRFKGMVKAGFMVGKLMQRQGLQQENFGLCNACKAYGWQGKMTKLTGQVKLKANLQKHGISYL